MASSTKAKSILLVIDPQVDFHPGGTLAIAGANEDSARTASLILKNVDEIDEIYVTLDSHHVSATIYDNFLLVFDYVFHEIHFLPAFKAKSYRSCDILGRLRRCPSRPIYIDNA